MERNKITAHPQVTLSLTLDKCPSKIVEVTAFADTATKSDLWWFDKFESWVPDVRSLTCIHLVKC